ncbi:substrate-binding domain-containing protein, partial [Intestinibaculum porci]|uniref:substrate-binding domain-containing protein n=1 Tax=Intestinibaculum porci TaxID=2487118 RepID=UPI002409298F
MHEKKRLGILIETTDEYNLELIRGAQAAADESDAELVVFTGTGAQRRTHFEDFLNKNNMAYDYANIAGIDQLLVPVSNIILGSHMTTEQFLARYDIPLITLNYYNEHYSSVMYDAGKGVIDEVSFMINKGCRHIAFIGGPADRQGTKARFEAYKMALSYHQISLDFSLVCHCANYTSYNRDIIEPFLKAHPEIDGICTVTDRLAYCVYDILHDLKKNIGKDILVG